MKFCILSCTNAELSRSLCKRFLSGSISSQNGVTLSITNILNLELFHRRTKTILQGYPYHNFQNPTHCFQHIYLKYYQQYSTCEHFEHGCRYQTSYEMSCHSNHKRYFLRQPQLFWCNYSTLLNEAVYSVYIYVQKSILYLNICRVSLYSRLSVFVITFGASSNFFHDESYF